MRKAAGGVLVAAAAAVAAIAGPATATRALPAPPPATAARVLIIAVPDLRWADVRDMPHLRAFTGSHAVGNLSVRSEDEVTRCGDGLLQISAGTRVRRSHLPCTMSALQLRDAGIHNRRGNFEAQVGALGSALARAHLTTAVVGAEAAPILADEDGAVDSTVDSVAAGLAVARVVAVVDDQLVSEPDRAVARAALDAAIADQLHQAGQARVVLVGSSDGADGPAHLHVAVISDPPLALSSGSTHRADFVQLVDVAPTVLSWEQVAVPDEMVGRPMDITKHAASSLSSLVDDDVHARLAADVGGPTRNGLGIALAVALTLWLLGWRRARFTGSALLVAPVMTYLVQVLPWWRWGTGAYITIVAGASVVVAAALTRAFRNSPVGLMLSAPALTAAVLAVDQLAGAPLDLSAPMGDNPLVAGRFHGMGNVAFGLMCASLLFLAAIWASGLETRRGRISLIAVVTVVALVVDGAPVFGDDFGGILALLPSALLLGALAAGMALTWRRILAGVAIAGAVAVGVAFADYARPASEQTHVGTFVGHVLHGGSDPVLRRKARAMLRSVGNVALDVPVLIALTGLLTGRVRQRLSALQQPGLGMAVAACTTLAVLGSLLNDSGIVVAAAVMLAVGPAVISADRP